MASNISRRAFVARAVAVASSVALPTLANSARTSAQRLASRDSDKEILDLAIVGAGISGILRVTVFEAIRVKPQACRQSGQ
jgi:hypothetical protein